MSKYVFGVDVGGTTVKMGLFDDGGKVLEKWEIPTRTEDSGKNILPDVAESIVKKMQEKKLTKEDVLGAGVGVPGPVDGEGVVHGAVNLGWSEVDVEEMLSKLTGVSVKAGNDANMADAGRQGAPLGSAPPCGT